MALKGTFYGSTSNDRITPKIQWSAVQSIAGNYSDITATLTYRRNNSYTTEGSWSGALTIGDQTFKGKKRLKITNTADAVAISATARISHNDLGALTVTISATGAISGSTLTATTISEEISPDTIARASAVSAANAEIGSRSTVVVSRKNDNFTHSIAYLFGDLSGYIDAEGNPVEEETVFSETTVNFLLPESFYGQIPNDPSGVCTLTCRTYHGSDRIGDDQTGTLTATAGENLCKPVVTGAVRDRNPVTVALTGNDSVLVQHASIARCQIDAQPQKGAAITQKRIGGVTVEGDTLDIEAPGFHTLEFEAQDSRGYKSVLLLPVTQIPYVVLTNNATVQRTDPTSGNAILTLQGSCWRGNFGMADNTLTATVEIDGQTQIVSVVIGEDHRYAAELALSGLDYTKAHTVKVTVTDKAMSAQQTLTLQKGIPVFDWSDADFRFNVPVEVASLTVGGVPLPAYIQSIIQGGS